MVRPMVAVVSSRDWRRESSGDWWSLVRVGLGDGIWNEVHWCRVRRERSLGISAVIAYFALVMLLPSVDG